MSDSSAFQGRIVLVTGGGRGIGKAHCEGFAAKGAAVVVADIRGDLASQCAAELQAKGTRALAVEVDVADEPSVTRMFARVEHEMRRLDFLVNNAAVMLDLERPFKPFWETPYEEWQRVMDVNVGGVFLCCKHARPLMERSGGGRIVNIGSDAVWKGYEGQLAYFASKGAVTVMTRNLARELGPFGINVNCVAPGYTLSGAVRDSDFMQSVKPKVMASCCIQRDLYPADVTGSVLFLCGPESACITGQSLVVNCGAIMP